MKSILRIFVLLAVFIATGISQASAQQGKAQKPIVPGEKGALPKVTLPAEAGGNLFTGLWISVDEYTDMFGGRSIVSELSFPDPAEFDADSYTVQIQQAGEWKNHETINSGHVGISVDINIATRFRLKINGGEKDGWISNEVTAIVPGISSKFRSSSLSNADKQAAIVGVEYGKSLALNVESHVGKDGSASEETVTYTVADGTYRYSWFRRNPHTWELTAIDGANKPTYTATLEDVGYELVLMVTGDNTHCGFMQLFVMGGDYNTETIVSIPVGFSFDYMGNDGFVLNTDYILPEDCTFTLKSYSQSLWEWVTTALTSDQVAMRKPGQYEVRVGSDLYEGAEIGISTAGVMFTNPQEMPNLDPDTGGPVEGTYLWFSSPQIFPYQYQQPLTVNTTFNGNPIETTVELIGRNLDGELTTVAMQNTKNGETSFYVFPNDHYIKVQGTDETCDTYYPNAAKIDDATAVKPGMDDTMQPVSVTISMIPDNTYVENRFIIEPGSDGDLPALPVFEKKNGFFGGFGVKRIYFDTLDYIWVVEFDMPWRNLPGDGKVTIQCRASENDSWGTPSSYSISSDGTPYEVRFGNASRMTYRLAITGGSMDGYVSNEVTVVKPKKQAWIGIGWSEPLFIGVAYPVYSHYVELTLVEGSESSGYKKTKVDRSEIKQTYSWYLRHPETGEMTLIEGASKRTYVPKMEDVGYELISVLRGDQSQADFYSSHNHGVVMLPILCSVAYAGDEGILLNTNYVLPDVQENMWFNGSDTWQAGPGDEGFSQTQFAEGKLKTVKPGQYAMYMDLKDEENVFFHQIGYGNSPYILCRMNPRWQGYRQFFISEAEVNPIPPVPFVVKKGKENLKNVAIDVIGTNIEGKTVVLQTAQPKEGNDTIFVTVRQGSYYFRTHKTDDIAATFYPNTLNKVNAECLFLCEDLFWQEPYSDKDFAFVIEAQEGIFVMGDANDDGTVNAADIVEVVNYIMGHPSDKFNEANADANDDGSVNAADIVMIVNIIMGKVATWKQVGTGTFTYTNWWGTSDSPLVKSGYKLYLQNGTDNVYKIAKWGEGTPVDYIFTWDKETNVCATQKGLIGYTHSSYGVMSVGDVSTYINDKSYEDYPSKYVPEEKTFYFYNAYFVADGSNWGLRSTPESFKVEWNDSAAPN